jgi:type II secretion system (T2SS) protein M
MRLADLTAKDRRAIFLGAAVLVPTLFYIWGVKPYRAGINDMRDQLEAARTALSREKAAVAATRADPGAQHAADSALDKVTARLFAGRDDAIASSELAAYLGDIARRSRVLMQDAGTRPSSVSPEGIRTLRVEIRAESDIQGIVKFLQTLEGGSKLVRVDRLEISRTPGLEDKNGFETLGVAATISGFAFGGSSSDSASRPRPRSGGAP